MKLSDLLKYDKITIQCHDNPDADAIGSGYALYAYLQDMGKTPVLMYSGRRMTKDNLVIFVESLEIPIVHKPDNTEKIDGLLVTIDCQYGASNVTKFNADDVAIIDHHQQEISNIEKTYIVSNLASCSTLIWKMLKDEGFDLSYYPTVQTALYYGLYTDSGQFTNINNPIDKDMKDDLDFDQPLLNKLQNSNISARELEIAGVAMIRALINKEMRFAVVKAEPCDQNILGLISDFVLQVSEIDYCIVFNMVDTGIRFSIRSCAKEIKANHLAGYVSKGIGSGGGHVNKAGGYISRKEFSDKYLGLDESSYFLNKMLDYRNGYEIIDVDKYSYDISTAKTYFKKKVAVGYVVASDIIEVGTDVVIRTLEGDLNVTITEDTYIMIGIKGEIHPISKKKFEKSYILSDEPYTATLEYHPKAIVRDLHKEYSLVDYAKTCITTGTNTIYAKPLVGKGAKVFTAWDKDCYMLGEEGDYIVARCDDVKDVYIIEKDIFGITYEEVKES